MKRILLIEDDIALRENTAELLELSAYDVLTAPNGKVGIEMAVEQQPDLIVCDIMMPEVDGYGVLQALANNEHTRQIPFVFLSAKTEHKEIRKGMNMGADDYLTKPFDEEDLMNAIESRLAKSKLVAQQQVSEEQSEKEDDFLSLHELKNHIDDNGEELSLKKGEHLYEKGMHANTIYLILKGVIKTHTMDENGKELITGLHKADDLLGFSSFDGNAIHAETATAVEKVSVMGLSKTAVKAILEDNQSLSLAIMDDLHDHLADVKEQLLQMAYGSVRKKTAQTILKFVEVLAKKPDEPIKIARTDLASVAGIAPESLIRTLSAFKKQHLIEIEGRTIKVLDTEGLANLE